MARALRNITEHPLTVLVTATGLFVGGLMELIEDLVPDFEHVIDMHHGVMLLGLVGMLRGLTELAEGAEKAASHPALGVEADSLDEAAGD
jgi:hypothetical protein